MIQLPLNEAIFRLGKYYTDYTLKLGKNGTSFAAEIVVPNLAPAVGISFQSLTNALHLAKVQLSKNIQTQNFENDIFTAALQEVDFDRAVAQMEDEDKLEDQLDDDWEDDDFWY